MNTVTSSRVARIVISQDKIFCRGLWTLQGVASLTHDYLHLPWPKIQEPIVDCSAITHLDSAGAYLLQKCLVSLASQGCTPKLEKLKPQFDELLAFITREVEDNEIPKLPEVKPHWLKEIGRLAYHKFEQGVDFLHFIGESLVSLGRNSFHPQRFPWRLWLNIIDVTGYRALPIIALLSFSIGLVLAYQLGLQLKLYGATIYVVNLQGVAVLREFGPLITAIIIAGRTSSSYTAQLGTMKVKEEIDALKTMGISPIERLVLPRVLGLLIALPLLTVWADIFGVFGGMMVAKNMLDITVYKYFHYFESSVSLRHYFVGLIKAPVFALIAATVGCYQGFQVIAHAESVGKQTTKSVVQSIFLIIIADAIFSIIFRWE